MCSTIAQMLLMDAASEVSCQMMQMYPVVCAVFWIDACYHALHGQLIRVCVCAYIC